MELTAWPTSLSACSSSTESASSTVRASSCLNRFPFWIAIALCFANVVTNSICRFVNGSTFVRISEITPITCPSLSIGTPSMVRCPPARTISGQS